MKKSNADFISRQKSMLKVDFKRMFLSPLTYIMLGVSFVLPILILVMTSFMGKAAVDPATGTETTTETFTNVWQAIGSASGNATAGMDILSMCNINLLYFLIVVFECLFIGEEFRSGYAKNLFTIRPKKLDYIVSKTVIGFTASVGMLLMYFIGAMIGGSIAGLSFDPSAVGAAAGGIVCCMIAKIFISLVFVGIALALSAAGKQKLWVSILGSFAAGMLLFTMIPMITPLNANALNIVVCAAGGVLFAAGLGAVGNIILNKTSLV